MVYVRPRPTQLLDGAMMCSKFGALNPVADGISPMLENSVVISKYSQDGSAGHG